MKFGQGFVLILKCCHLGHVAYVIVDSAAIAGVTRL